MNFIPDERPLHIKCPRAVQWSDTTYKLAPEPYDCLGPLRSPPPAHACDACGAEASRFWHGGGLWVCEECDLPRGHRITSTEAAAWAALMRINAGFRALELLKGLPIGAWFRARYRRAMRFVTLA